AVPAATASPAAAYRIKGFRSAVFGMTQAQVRTAIAADFAGATIAQVANPTEGTAALQIDLPQFVPGPGAARVTYIFGATTRTLTHVNVVWLLDGEPDQAGRESLLKAAVALAQYFRELPDPPKATTAVRPTGPNSLSMFAAVDAQAAAVEVTVQGVAYEAGGVASPVPHGPALLRVSYSRNAANPDIGPARPRG
ncbi:MAG TPA: hypothetical protein VFQ57_06860, partial [Sphingomonas sp.]|nr:hypothetical protein [Sphingomonas sp.]